MQFQSAYISTRLEQSNRGLLTAWSVIAAFTTYFCMYAFRKPFTVAQYEDLVYWGVGYKVILLFAQVSGYALSKFIGIKVISEMTPNRRAAMILSLIGVAHLALLPYAVAPYWLKPVFLFCNGLPLGMVFGCVFAFLEGRRVTEAMAAGLCASFIMASGTVKTVGAILMQDYGVSEFWMPFLTGALFWLPLIIGVWMLQQIPPPGELDVTARSKRSPFNGVERRQFYSRNALGLTVLILLMVLLTIFRSVRDDYAAEIWSGFGVEKPEIFAQSEMLVAIAVVALSAAVVFIGANYRAFKVGMSMVGLGFACALVTTLSYWGTTHWTEDAAFQFMVLIGISLYVPYVLFHTTIYERVIAMLRNKSNVGYLLYLGDFAGYISTVVLMAIVNLVFEKNLDFVSLLFWLALIISPVSIVGTVVVVLYFRLKQTVSEAPLPEPFELETEPRLGTNTGVL
ncbi:DUF5690 family protein [Gimesia fumaroli]|uniref:Major Facilitator Superfamily protein n=1 Tax=Gimesia fumaroli TaxID=2527976 RepID=A0A518I5C2_9PLAN|nr:DUF5690 family protein [Gimesia fumaroli]QDV48304.1 hypothetical protein Enr17x_03150 [Gimesia fumaroli]